MRRIALILIVVGIVAGGWYFLRNYEITGLGDVVVRPKGNGAASADDLAAPPVSREGDRIRIASFAITGFGPAKQRKRHVAEALANIVRRFDVVALQEIESDDPRVLRRFVDQVNATGRHYDFAAGPPAPASQSRRRLAFVFDRSSVEIDRATLYTSTASARPLSQPPLVGHFRVRGPAAERAFTFKLVNVQIDPAARETELAALAEVYRHTLRDGSAEDDVILLGDFAADDQAIGRASGLEDLDRVVSGVPSNVEATALLDNILLRRAATVEFTGRAGVLNFVKEFELTLDAAREVSRRRPVWAEFSITEPGESVGSRAEPSETR